MMHAKIKTLDQYELKKRSHALKALARPCQLCPRQCKIDRRFKQGFCQQPEELMIAVICAHHGEEPALSGSHGAGTVFVAGCNMRCGFCQNHQISQRVPKPQWKYSPQRLAVRYLELQQAGCHNIEWVSPTPHLPGLVEALCLAREQGLSLPVVYNSNGYESLEVLSLLEGVVQIYLPDLKYATDELADAFSATPNYQSFNRVALGEMWRQGGTLELDPAGIAQRGLLIRHLIIPGYLLNTRLAMQWIAAALGREIAVSLMTQFVPANRVLAFEPPFDKLYRQITRREYEIAFRALIEAGLDNGWVQEYRACKQFLPDFDLENPFAKKESTNVATIELKRSLFEGPFAKK